jgi:2,4-dienoyl-CoA reductase-like NADH-dependent reductase (Old Yellow Enzyme family)
LRSSVKLKDGYVPDNLDVEYYAQRASPGRLMLTKATPLSRYAREILETLEFPLPIRCRDEKKVANAVHGKGR